MSYAPFYEHGSLLGDDNGSIIHNLFQTDLITENPERKIDSHRPLHRQEDSRSERVFELYRMADSAVTLCDDEDLGSICIKNTSKRAVARFPTSAKMILANWWSKHANFPYPTDHEKELLSNLSGLSRAQVGQWFANARKRGKRPSTLQQQAHQGDSGQPKLPHMGSLHPFERWLTLGLEFEAAPRSAIIEAVTLKNDPKGTRKFRTPAVRVEHNECNTNWQYFRAGTSSISSMEIRSYAANGSVDAEQQCLDSFTSVHRLDRRNVSIARKARSIHQNSKSERNSRTSQKFPCTFCEAGFSRKHEWQRHEKSCHLPVEKWTCTPHGGTVVDHDTCDVTCAFCTETDPSPEHLQTHGYTACAQRPLSERTFYRKDHLRQHLRLTHRVTKWCKAMESWKTQPEVFRSRCGFCDLQFETWQTRVDHLADHFVAGCSMEEWSGDWGFDPEVSAILDNAKLPQSLGNKTTANMPLFENFANWQRQLEGSSFSQSTSITDSLPGPYFGASASSFALGSLTEDLGTEPFSALEPNDRPLDDPMDFQFPDSSEVDDFWADPSLCEDEYFMRFTH